MILGGDESYYWRAIRKDKQQDGAHDFEVSNFLNQNNYEHQLISINSKIEEINWLKQMSFRFPVYVSGFFKTKPKRGRPAERHHSFAVSEGKIYDPAEEFELDFEACSHYSELTIKSVIVIFRENQNYGRN
jgi:hypothetical protein